MLQITLLAPLLLAVQSAPEDVLLATVPDGFELTRPISAGSRTLKKTLPFRVSPRGDRVAFFARGKRKTVLFVGDEEVAKGDLAARPVFSADGEHLAFAIGKAARNGTATWKVHVDDDVVAKEDWVGPLALSADGEAVAYWVQPGYRTNRRGGGNEPGAELVFARRKGKRFKSFRSDTLRGVDLSLAPVFGEGDETAIGRATMDRKPTLLAVGGREVDVLLSSPTPIWGVALAPRGGRHAVVQLDPSRAREGASWRPFWVAVDGAWIDVDADAIGLPTFSRDGAHVAFVYHAEDRFGVGVDDTLLDAQEWPISRVEVDASGTCLAWVVHEKGTLQPVYRVAPSSGMLVQDGAMRVAVGHVGSKDPPHLGPAVERVGAVVFSPDGAHAAYVADGHVRCGEAAAGPFDAIDALTWLDDTTIAFGTREGRAFRWRHLVVGPD